MTSIVYFYHFILVLIRLLREEGRLHSKAENAAVLRYEEEEDVNSQREQNS